MSPETRRQYCSALSACQDGVTSSDFTVQWYVKWSCDVSAGLRSARMPLNHLASGGPFDRSRGLTRSSNGPSDRHQFRPPGSNGRADFHSRFLNLLERVLYTDRVLRPSRHRGSFESHKNFSLANNAVGYTVTDRRMEVDDQKLRCLADRSSEV